MLLDLIEQPSVANLQSRRCFSVPLSFRQGVIDCLNFGFNLTIAHQELQVARCSGSSFATKFFCQTFLLSPNCVIMVPLGRVIRC
jgi:hypothetical protein